MLKTPTSDAGALKETMTRWLGEFPGDLICARQIWYEALSGCGVPSLTDVTAIEAVLHSLEDWKHVGMVRYEKFGMQNSFMKTNKAEKEH